MFDWPEEICDEVVFVHPPKVIAEATIMTDKIEATILAQLLAEPVPDA